MKILRLHISLNGIKPAIWRRLEIPADLSLHGLHQCIQAAFGWGDEHLHAFDINGLCFAAPNPDGELDDLDSRKQPLWELEGKFKSFGYTYDFGDDWEHKIKIEDWAESDPTAIYPRCTGGANACPPEDCGGEPGYEELLAALADPKHERHAEMKEWLEEVFDPKAFDLAQTNAALKRLKLKALKPSKIPSPLFNVKSPLGAEGIRAIRDLMKQELKNAGPAMTPELEKMLMDFVEIKLGRMSGMKKGTKSS